MRKSNFVTEKLFLANCVVVLPVFSCEWIGDITFGESILVLLPVFDFLLKEVKPRF